LLDRGHTRIGMIVGERGPGGMRLQGYERALAERQIPYDETLVRTGGFTVTGGYEDAQALLALDPRPTAMFAANDLMAMGALIAIKEASLRIPDDIAVIGIDNIPAAELVSPRLTTVALFQERLGQRAAEMVFERLNGVAHAGGRCEEMPYELIVRESA
jgi:LacI family transcriptional regulator